MQIGDAIIDGNNATVVVTNPKDGNNKTDVHLKKENGSWKVEFNMESLMGGKDIDEVDNMINKDSDSKKDSIDPSEPPLEYPEPPSMGDTPKEK